MNNSDKKPLKVSELVDLLNQYPSNADVYFEGTAICNSSFTSIKLPVASIRSLQKYSDSDTYYLSLHGVKKEEG